MLTLASMMALPSGCGESTSGVVDPRVTASLQQYREDEVMGVLQVSVTNTSAAAVRIDHVEVRWPGFAGTPSADPGYELAPGATVDLPVPVVPAQCRRQDASTGSVPSAPGAPAQAGIRLADGTTVSAPLSTSGVLERIYSADCDQRYVASRVKLDFGSDWVRRGTGASSALLGTLVAQRLAGDGILTLVSLDGSVLLSLAFVGDHAESAGQQIAAGEQRATFPVVLRSTARCDGHALGESKKTFIFDAVVDLGDGLGIPYTLSPDAPARAEMQQLIDDACAR